jgi:hypothetical protein
MIYKIPHQSYIPAFFVLFFFHRLEAPAQMLTISKYYALLSKKIPNTISAF